MENRMLLSGIVAIFLFAIIMGFATTNLGGMVIGPGEGPEECTEQWTCSDWSTCANGQQTKGCTDQNDCGTTISLPAQVQACEIPGEWHTIIKFADTENEETDPFFIPGDRWRIDWNCVDLEDHEEDGLTLITVYRQGLTTAVTSDSGQCIFAEQDDILVDGPGWFYLDVQTVKSDFWSADVNAFY